MPAGREGGARLAGRGGGQRAVGASPLHTFAVQMLLTAQRAPTSPKPPLALALAQAPPSPNMDTTVHPTCSTPHPPHPAHRPTSRAWTCSATALDQCMYMHPTPMPNAQCPSPSDQLHRPNNDHPSAPMHNAVHPNPPSPIPKSPKPQSPAPNCPKLSPSPPWPDQLHEPGHAQPGGQRQDGAGDAAARGRPRRALCQHRHAQPLLQPGARAHQRRLRRDAVHVPRQLRRRRRVARTVRPPPGPAHAPSFLCSGALSGLDPRIWVVGWGFAVMGRGGGHDGRAVQPTTTGGPSSKDAYSMPKQPVAALCNGPHAGGGDLV